MKTKLFLSVAMLIVITATGMSLAAQDGRADSDLDLDLPCLGGDVCVYTSMDSVPYMPVDITPDREERRQVDILSRSGNCYYTIVFNESGGYYYDELICE